MNRAKDRYTGVCRIVPDWNGFSTKNCSFGERPIFKNAEYTEQATRTGIDRMIETGIFVLPYQGHEDEDTRSDAPVASPSVDHGSTYHRSYEGV